jgi:hypothetical protein
MTTFLRVVTEIAAAADPNDTLIDGRDSARCLQVDAAAAILANLRSCDAGSSRDSRLLARHEYALLRLSLSLPSVHTELDELKHRMTIQSVTSQSKPSCALCVDSEVVIDRCIPPKNVSVKIGRRQLDRILLDLT